jgi:hypothetical protein
MLAGVSAFIGIFELRWNVLLLFLAIGIGTCMTGLFVFSPIHVLLLFVIAFLIMVICSVTYAGRYCDRSIVFKFLSGIVMAFFIPVISVLWMSSNEIVTSRIAPFADLENFKLFPEKYWKVREICSSIALKVWNKEHWLGTGIGSFAIDIPFHAKPVDWIVLKEGYNTAINGWWQILAECGLIGILSILLVFGGMLFSFLRRFILSLGIISYYPAAALGIISSTVVLSQGFFDLTFLRPEVIVPIVALFSIGTGSFISASNNRTDVKNASDNG